MGYSGRANSSSSSDSPVLRLEDISVSGCYDASCQAASVIYGGTATALPPVEQIPPDSPTDSNPAPPAKVTKAHHWSTSAQTLLDQPPAALPLQLMLLGLVFCLGFGAWATWGEIDEVGKAQGKLVPQGEVYQIDPIELGKVASISIKEGQLVKKGQVLMELDTQLAAGEVERLQQLVNADQTKRVQQKALIERIRLEAQTRKQIAQAATKAQQAAIAQAKAKAGAIQERLHLQQIAKAASQDRLEGLKPLTTQAKQLLQQQQEVVQAYKQRIETLKPLSEKGAISKELVFQAQQSLRVSQSAITQSRLQESTNAQEQIFQAQQSLREYDSAIAQSQGDWQQTTAEIDQLQAELTQKQAAEETTELETQQKIQQLELELTQLEAKIAENKNLLASAQAKLKQRFLYAPVDGVVSSLNVANVGEVVQPGQNVAEIAPEGVPLVLSASLPNREAGFINKGMPVQVKLDAYPYQEYGIVSGKVTSVSADAKADEQLGTVYKVEVALDRNYVTDEGQTIDFKAGQTASADIIIRHRRIVDILLDPLQQLQQSGLKL